MAEDHSLINVSGVKVGIMGLKQALEETYEQYGTSFSDEELGTDLLARLKKKNYIPEKAEQGHARAFVREYKKLAGLPVQEERSGLEIKVFGPGCARCDQLEQQIFQVLSELNLTADVEHVRDAREIAKAGIMGSPGLMINGEVVAVGKVPSKEKLKSMLQKES
ncbi:MAG: thioredoxin family protein [Desulfohalobiaceae bacterium]|nr:thioredoxin family protein [Desulfohalobiaceae bacterium]